MIYAFLYLLIGVIIFILQYWGLCYNYSKRDRYYKNDYSFSEFMEEWYGPIVFISIFWLPLIMLTPLWMLGLGCYFLMKQVKKYYNIN